MPLLSKFCRRNVIDLYIICKAEQATWTPPTCLLRAMDEEGREYVFLCSGEAMATSSQLTSRTFYRFEVPGFAVKPSPKEDRFGFKVAAEVRCGKALSATKEGVESFKVKLPEISASLGQLNQKEVGQFADVLGYVKEMQHEVQASLSKTIVTLQADNFEQNVEVLGQTRQQLESVSKGDLVMFLSCKITKWQHRVSVQTNISL